jgi:hypothetical protein
MSEHEELPIDAPKPESSVEAKPDIGGPRPRRKHSTPSKVRRRHP